MPNQIKQTKQAEGFTIIEVVLVLAIAGLIFLMVFVALPALQRSQRDTQRRNDMSRVDTSLVQYQTNHSNLSNNLPDVSAASKWVAPENNAFSDVADDGRTSVSGCSGQGKVACAFVRDYMNTGSSENDGKVNNFEDPDGVPYSMVITPNWATKTPESVTFTNTNNNAQSVLSDTGNKDQNNNALYTISDGASGHAFDARVIYVIPGGHCVGDSVSKSTKRHFAILYRLEGAGTYCIDDQ